MKIIFDKTRNALDITLSKGETAPSVTIRSEAPRTIEEITPLKELEKQIVIDLVEEMAKNPYAFVSDDRGVPSSIMISWAHAGRSDTPYVNLFSDGVSYRLDHDNHSRFVHSVSLVGYLHKRLKEIADDRGGFYLSKA